MIAITQATATFDIRDHLDKLESDGGSESKNEKSFHCPECHAPNFKVDLKTGKYYTFSCSCASTEEGKKRIRDAIAPLRKEKTSNPKQEREWIYRDQEGFPRLKTIRIDNGEGKKQIFQNYFVNGKWVKNLPSHIDENEFRANLTPLYFDEIKAAIAQNLERIVLIVEGEGVADKLRNLGLLATTNIMGSGKWKDTYSQQLKEIGVSQIAIAPDCDQPGIKHGDQIAESLQRVGITPYWLYAFPNSPFWNQAPKDRGLDLKDYLEDHPKMSAQDLINAIEFARRRFAFELEQSDRPNNPLDDEETSLTEKIDQLINENNPRSILSEKLALLAQKQKLAYSNVEKIYNQRLKELERQTSSEDTKKAIEELKSFDTAHVPLDKVLPKPLADPLKRISNIIGGTDEAILTSLLPIVASLLPIGNKLELIKQTNFYSLPILYTGLIGESGTAKSPIQKTVLNPLFTLQSEYQDEYQEALKQWKKDCKKAEEEGEEFPPEPKPQTVFTQDATSEAVALMQSEQPDNGFLIWKDELSAVIKDADAYRGKGSDAEKLLSGRDGTPLKVDRASGKKLYIKQSAYSITGGIQPDTLKKQIDFNDPTGHWARFLWSFLPLKQLSFPDDEIEVDVQPMLKSLYRKLRESTPNVVKLSDGAKALYRDYYNQLEAKKYQESRQGLRAVYAKMKGDTGVIALLLHCLEGAFYAENNYTTEPVLTAETMQKAIALSKYYICQVKAVHSEGDAEDGELPALYKKLLELSGRKGWIKAKDVRNNNRVFRNYKADDIRSMFNELAAMGYGELSGSGSKLQFKAVGTVVSGSQSVVTTDYHQNDVNHGGSNNNNDIVVSYDTSYSNDYNHSSNNNGGDKKGNSSQDIKATVTNDRPTSKTPSSSESESVVNPTTDDYQCPPVTTNPDQIIPVKAGDYIQYRHVLGNIISSEVTEVEVVKSGKSEMGKIQRIQSKTSLIYSDSDDLLAVMDIWGKEKWRNPKEFES